MVCFPTHPLIGFALAPFQVVEVIVTTWSLSPVLTESVRSTLSKNPAPVSLGTTGTSLHPGWFGDEKHLVAGRSYEERTV